MRVEAADELISGQEIADELISGQEIAIGGGHGDVGSGSGRTYRLAVRAEEAFLASGSGRAYCFSVRGEEALLALRSGRAYRLAVRAEGALLALGKRLEFCSIELHPLGGAKRCLRSAATGPVQVACGSEL